MGPSDFEVPRCCPQMGRITWELLRTLCRTPTFTESESLRVGAWDSRLSTSSQGDSDLGIMSVSTILVNEVSYPEKLPMSQARCLAHAVFLLSLQQLYDTDFVVLFYRGETKAQGIIELVSSHLAS